MVAGKGYLSKNFSKYIVNKVVICGFELHHWLEKANHYQSPSKIDENYTS